MAGIKKKSLILFTSAFPFGKGEQFLETEIQYLSSAFDQIYIYPLKNNQGNPRSVPENVVCVESSLYGAHKRFVTLFLNPLIFLKVWSITLLNTHHRFRYIKRFYSWSMFLLDRINDASWLKKEIKKYNSTEEVVLYSYWCNYWAIILCLLKGEKQISQFNVRVHGGDLDESRRKENYFPFREFLYNTNPNIYSISRYGVNYIKNNYNVVPNITLSRLGVTGKGLNPYDESANVKTIVSCSFIYPLKRVNLIIDFICHLGVKVNWIHFGDGIDEKKMKLYAEEKLGPKNNISYEFKGFVNNDSIIEFYKTNSVDLFINLSELEGIPVSIMEAISFGIPCVGCNVGGVGEIVNNETGFLIDKDFKMDLLVNWVEKYFDSDVEKRKKIRESTYKFWKNNFDADYNYRQFVEEICNHMDSSMRKL